VAEEPRPVVDEADQEGFDVGAASSQHFARAVMEVEVQENAGPRILLRMRSPVICGTTCDRRS
jgi:hypothetical protein